MRQRIHHFAPYYIFLRAGFWGTSPSKDVKCNLENLLTVVRQMHSYLRLTPRSSVHSPLRDSDAHLENVSHQENLHTVNIMFIIGA